MFRWLNLYNKATSQTKVFVLNWLIYGLAIIITTVYCYARLDYVRSYRTPGIDDVKQNTEQYQSPNTIKNKNDAKKS